MKYIIISKETLKTKNIKTTNNKSFKLKLKVLKLASVTTNKKANK